MFELPVGFHDHLVVVKVVPFQYKTHVPASVIDVAGTLTVATGVPEFTVSL